MAKNLKLKTYRQRSILNRNQLSTDTEASRSANREGTEIEGEQKLG